MHRMHLHLALSGSHTVTVIMCSLPRLHVALEFRGMITNGAHSIRPKMDKSLITMQTA